MTGLLKPTRKSSCVGFVLFHPKWPLQPNLACGGAFSLRAYVRRNAAVATRIAAPAVVLSGVPGLASAQVARQRLNGRSGTLLATMALVAVTAFAPGAVRAQDATWLLTPASGNFNTATNWNPATAVPTGTAFFGTSNTTALTFAANTVVGGWTFNAGAPAYTFVNNQSLTFNGAGIVINGGGATITNTLTGFLNFNGNNTAASGTINNNGQLNFNITSTAGNATINNNIGGLVNFNFSSTAGNAKITDNYNMDFNNNSTAGSATITNGASGDLRFSDTSTAGNATITNNNTIFFFDNATGGNAAITNNSGASVNFSGSTGPAGNNQLTASSIAGAGSFLLGANQLTVGGNNISTDVSGVISGTGSLVKVGAGTLTLSGNDRLGSTTIDGGTLAVDGGTLNASNAIIVGSTSGSSGTLNIGAGGSVTTQNLAVGQSGVGMLAVQNGGTLTDFGGFVGDLPGSRGTVTVSGSGSTWTNTGTIQVGALGSGT